MSGDNTMQVFFDTHWTPYAKEIELAAMSMSPSDAEDIVSGTLVTLLSDWKNNPQGVESKFRENRDDTMQKYMNAAFNVAVGATPVRVKKIRSIKAGKGPEDSFYGDLVCDGFSEEKGPGRTHHGSVLYVENELDEPTSDYRGLYDMIFARIQKRTNPRLISENVKICWESRDGLQYEYGKDIANALLSNDSEKKTYVTNDEIVEAVNFTTEKFDKDQLFALLGMVRVIGIDSTTYVVARKILDQQDFQNEFSVFTVMLEKIASLSGKSYNASVMYEISR